MRTGEFMFPPRSAYLHIPFCHRRCFYCDFAVVPLGDLARGGEGPGSQSIKTYLEHLHKEIELSPIGPPLATVYIGGGTPSLLTPVQISGLLVHLKKHFGLQGGAEITLEMDPATFDLNDLESFLDVGVNRVSLGGQSFDDNVLKRIGRKHQRQDLIQAAEWLHKAHQKGELSSWSLDLIQNLPGQDLQDWKLQLNEAIATNAPHLSIYDLSIEPGTVFSWLQRRGELELPNENLSRQNIELTSLLLGKAGFNRYEISNFALPGHRSRHNRVYWAGSGWWGFGQGATSSPWGYRFSRPRTRDGYNNWINDQQKYGPELSLLAENAKPIPLDDQLIVGLRRSEGINLELLAQNYGWNSKQSSTYLPLLEKRWQKAIERGWLRRSGKRYQLTEPEGMTFSNQVLVEIVIWWDSLPASVVHLPIFAEH
ncbi:radical SAM family heme chaperone HemW [Prochlorococcus sp. MIT 1300]|uniref:radical SAM family heme chaperone HemW n=1 Tax=Prochlorococcus sp. MIT 1300 TaxID=3096218 RepID=UPI002A74A0AA|nr:radical SAM family heme chaperone HemW [Prochlorococcus sp. MIT 1300]